MSKFSNVNLNITQNLDNTLVFDFDENLFASINDRLSYDENKFKTEEANFKEGNLKSQLCTNK